MKKLWQFGTKTKMQRFGFLVLIIGLISFFAWLYSGARFGFYIDDYYGKGFDFDIPRRHDFWIYKIFLFAIPLGLFLTWLYPSWQPVIKWIKGGN